MAPAEGIRAPLGTCSSFFYLLTNFLNFCCSFYDKFGTKYCFENILPPSEESINSFSNGKIKTLI